MKRSRAVKVFVVVGILTAFAIGTGCSRPVGLPADGTVHADQPAFASGQAQAESASDATAHTDSNAETGIPFHDAQSLPVGTLLTVRLKNSISTQVPGHSGTFDAVVDEPVTVDGNVLIPSGATVSGRVESAQVLKTKQSRNFVRLTLDSMDFAGHDFPIQTSSLFAQGKATSVDPFTDQASTPVIHLERGRRLTFRLMEPVYVAKQQPPTLQ